MKTKNVKFVTVKLPLGYGRDAAQQLGFATPEGEMSTKDWLAGSKNPWGLHNDLRFALNLGATRQGLRIMEAVEKALEAGRDSVDLLEADHTMLLDVINDPRRPAGLAPCPADLFRAAVPIFEAIEAAGT